jgi:hypothetical protein
MAAAPMNDAVSLDENGLARPLPPATLVGGRFQIKSFVRAEVGTEIYQAVDTRDNASSLLRVFSCPAAARVVLESDLTQAASIAHKNLLTILAWGYEGDRVYVASEPQDGASLRQIVDAKRGQNQVVLPTRMFCWATRPTPSKPPIRVCATAASTLPPSS